MFNKNNFCHVASNNRNEQKAGIFVYKTTDNLATITASGYFNEKIIDINLHDFIIHEWHDPADRTKVKYNLLCVTERTLDNVGTTVVKSDWEIEIENTLDELAEYIDQTFVRIDGASIMTGTLKTRQQSTGYTELHDGNPCGINHRNSAGQIDASFTCFPDQIWKVRVGTALGAGAYEFGNDSFRATNGGQNLGTSYYKWKNIFAEKINNGGDLLIPATSGTLATTTDVENAANAGTQLYRTGVWYAKMDSATQIPAEAEQEGRNYADFSQVDVNNRPIIVVYEYTNGAWTEADRITPPNSYNGYVTVTSKIWDIPEQQNQQGGQVLWSYTEETFTPYPRIVSTNNITITDSIFTNGTVSNTDLENVTTTMPQTPSNDAVVNKAYVDALVAAAVGTYLPDLFDFKWKDYTMTRAGWTRSDGNWKNSDEAYTHLYNDITGITATTETIAGTTITYYRATDGHKVVMADQETNVDAIYASTGIAWYYILDTENHRFKLPRTKFAFAGNRGNPGDYIAPTLPNVKATFGMNGSWTTSSGAVTRSGQGNEPHGWDGKYTTRVLFDFDASRSSEIYQNNATVQQAATDMYLYMYIGQ